MPHFNVHRAIRALTGQTAALGSACVSRAALAADESAASAGGSALRWLGVALFSMIVFTVELRVRKQRAKLAQLKTDLASPAKPDPQLGEIEAERDKLRTEVALLMSVKAKLRKHGMMLKLRITPKPSS